MKNLLLTLKEKTSKVFKSIHISKNQIRFGALILSIITTIGLGYFIYNWSIIAKSDEGTVSRFELWQRMEKNYGKQALDDLLTERVIEMAIKESGVRIKESLVKEEYSKIEKQFKTLDNGKIYISGKWVSKGDIISQIRKDLAIREILNQRAQPTESEIQNEYSYNKDKKYKDIDFSDVREDIKTIVFERKLQLEFTKWIADIKEKANIVKYDFE